MKLHPYFPEYNSDVSIDVMHRTLFAVWNWRWRSDFHIDRFSVCGSDCKIASQQELVPHLCGSTARTDISERMGLAFLLHFTLRESALFCVVLSAPRNHSLK